MKCIVDYLFYVQQFIVFGCVEQLVGIVFVGGVGLLVVVYVFVWLLMLLFIELCEILFLKVIESVVCQFVLQVFWYLYGLLLWFYFECQMGGMLCDIECGMCGIQQLILYLLYSILLMFVEVGFVFGFFVVKYEVYYVYVMFVVFVMYIVFIVKVINWCMYFCCMMNEFDLCVNLWVIDLLINYEMVKYFGNEEWEVQCYDENLKCYWKVVICLQNLLLVLNFGQQVIIGMGLVFILWCVMQGVFVGKLMFGDFVLINMFMLQLYILLNFFGVVYCELKQSLIDMDWMFGLLFVLKEVVDWFDVLLFVVIGVQVCFEYVNFVYELLWLILYDVMFMIEVGMMIVVVGYSGLGKLMLLWLLFCFYDFDWQVGGVIWIDGQDICDVMQELLCVLIGIVLQDIVLFNDLIYYNIVYG